MKALATALTLTLALVAVPSLAQSTPSEPSDAALWEVQLNVQKLFASPLNEIVMSVIEEEEPEVLEKIDAFVEAIGFDPRTAVQQVLLLGNSLEHPDVTAVMNLGETRGNLEGFMLAAPGYESEELDKDTMLHSFITEADNARIWVALPRRAEDGRYYLVASIEKSEAVRFIKKVAAAGMEDLSSPLTGDTILAVNVNDLSKVPVDLDEGEPGAAALKYIKSVVVKAASDSDRLTATCEICTDTPARAEQILQLLNGLKAMVQLAAEEDDDAQKVLEFAKKVKVAHAEGESRVVAEFPVEYQWLSKMIEEQL